MKYGIRLFKKGFDKKPIYDNKYISAKVDVYNGTEFEHIKSIKGVKSIKY